MTLDLVLLALVVLFAFVGALTGAAKQLAQVGALVAAYFFARPLGDLMGPLFVGGKQSSLAVGTVAATVISGAVLYVVIRMALRWALEKVLRRDGDNAPDRTLGFIFGGLKIFVLLWVCVSAVSFAAKQVSALDRVLPETVHDSIAFALSKRFNLFELTQFGPAEDLMTLAKAAKEPSARKQLSDSPALLPLLTDDRFKDAMNGNGDVSALLKSDRVVGMLKDQDFQTRLKTALQNLKQRNDILSTPDTGVLSSDAGEIPETPQAAKR